MKRKITILTLLAIFGLSSLIQAQIPTTGLVGYWPFNGNANDESGNGNNGVVNGATLTTDRFGNANSAYSFNGSSNFVQISNSVNLQTPLAISINAWVNFQTGGTESPRLVSKGWSPNGIEVHSISDVNHQVVYGGGFGGVGYGPTSTTNCQLNQWYMITSVDDGNVKYIYVNGILENSITHNYNSIPINSIDLFFGKNSQNNSDYLNGKLDDIGMWNRTLTQTEITALYNEGLCYQTITVTDTLIINANLTGFNPIAYQNSIKIYPNPTNSQINIDFGSNFSTMNGYTLKITNTLSQIVYTTTINTQLATVNLSTWSGNGIYFVHLIDALGNTIDIRKIVLQ